MTRVSAAAVASVRDFNRFYTRQLGLLERGLLGSELTLTEARVVYELAQHPRLTASELTTQLKLDPGYFSRLLRGLERRRYVERRADPADARRRWLTLSKRGRTLFNRLDGASRAQVGTLLQPLDGEQQRELLRAMRSIARLLEGAAPAEVVLRDLRSGDVGWIASRQGQLYAAEYGWDLRFEALVAEILAGFVRNFDPHWEQSWVAERDGEVVGSVLLVRVSDEVAKLRLLYVEPRARGTGLGRRLVDACIAGARQRGYRTLTLWTNAALLAARRIYQTAGFELVGEEPERNFGHDLTSETWSLELR